jgi:hypothetical protein
VVGGFPLAKALLEKGIINGSTTSPDKISILERPEFILFNCA